MAEEKVTNLGAGLKIEGLSVSPIQSSPYIAPYRLKFHQVTMVILTLNKSICCCCCCLEWKEESVGLYQGS